MNRLAPNSVLKAGQKLTYNNRKIVPKSVREGIVVNIPDRTLYYFKQGKLVRWLPVALGSATRNDKYVWQTPTGKFRITDKLQNPTWYVPVSIRSEMEEKGKEVLTAVPPGIDNPLGKYAIKTSIPGIMIHSTTKPWSIYGFVSHGCIRVTPADMEEFFREIKINTTGEIIYEPIKLTVTESGKIFIEVHQDIYEKGIDYLATANNLINKLNLSDRINWSTFKTVLKQKSGVAVDISL
jgi:lipoprotein-anchoring transpeptidase ErfK/SrfK